MRIRLQDLPPDRAAALVDLVRPGAPGEGLLLLRHRRPWLLLGGLLSLGLGVLSVWILHQGTGDWPRPADAAVPWVGLLGLVYGPLALVECFRRYRAELPACLLLTPFNLVRSRGSHRPLEVYRLSEAKSFQRIEEYHGTTWTGQGYAFVFDSDDKTSFSLRRAEDIAAADRVLALARAAGLGDPLPDLPGCRLGDLGPGYRHPNPTPGRLEKLLDPGSETWLAVLGLLLIAFVPYAIFR